LIVVELTESQQYDLFFELAKNLTHPSRDIRQSTIQAISKIANRRCSNLLMDKLELEQDVFLKASLLRVLGDIGTPNLLDAMDKYLFHFEPRIRSNAVESLVKLKTKDSESLADRIRPLLKDEHNRVVGTVLKELLDLGQSQHLPLLNLMLKGTDPLRRASALWVVGELHLDRFLDDVIFAMYSENYQVHSIAMKVLSRFGDLAIEPLFLNLALDDPLVRVYTFRYLEQCCDSITADQQKILFELSQTEEPYVAAFSLRILYKFSLPEAFDFLKEHLFSENSYLRTAAVEGYRFFTEIPEARQLLEQVVESETNPRLLATLIHSFEKFPSQESTELLKKLLNHKDPRVCANVIEVLGKMGDKRLLDLLAPFVENSNHRIMANAAVAMFRMGEKKVLGRLQEALSAGSTGLRASAAYALGEIGSREVVEILIEKLLDEQEQVRNQVINGLLKQDKEVLQRLVDKLKSSPRLTARKALAELVDGVSVEKNVESQIGDLLGLYADRVSAFDVPESLSDQEIGQLLDLLFCEEHQLRIYSIYALGEKRIQSAVPRLVCLLFERDEEIVGEALLALRKIGERKTLVFLRDIYPRMSGENLEFCAKTMNEFSDGAIDASYFDVELSKDHQEALSAPLEPT
jgi:HEAT repeat protein